MILTIRSFLFLFPSFLLKTAEFPPTSGDATLAGYSVMNEPEQTRRRIGYCPQFDALFQNMTGLEHVELYASIKGVPRKYIKEAANSKLDEMGLNELDRTRLAAGYSGGMKRKLSVACATIGQPQIVFLDEPSTYVPCLVQCCACALLV
jgi:ABC-type multidrug transport system ATPase subunit